jgi:hypothetical protein
MLLPPEGYMVVHGVDLAQWCKRHKIDLTDCEGPCQCGAIRRATLPIRLGRIYGVISEKCACGTDSRAPYALVLHDKDIQTIAGLEAFQKETQVGWEIWRRKEKERKRVARNAKRREQRQVQRESHGKDQIL